MYRTHARPTTAGVVSTAVMVLRAARLVIAIAPRALNWVEERASEPELSKSTTAKRQTSSSATDFGKRAHTPKHNESSRRPRAAARGRSALARVRA